MQTDYSQHKNAVNKMKKIFTLKKTSNNNAKVKRSKIIDEVRRTRVKSSE